MSFFDSMQSWLSDRVSRDRNELSHGSSSFARLNIAARIAPASLSSKKAGASRLRCQDALAKGAGRWRG